MRIFSTFLAIAILLLPMKEAAATYSYINPEGEYKIDLPEAPTGKSIWADDGQVPYLDPAPKFGLAGEYATYHKVLPDTGEFIDVKITFLKAERDFLLTRNEENIIPVMDEETKGLSLEGEQFKITPGADTIKWATLTGFSVDKSNNALYTAVHYLTGKESLTIVKVTYTVENEKFNADYQKLLTSIKYIGQ